MSKPRPPKIDRDALAGATQIGDDIETLRNRLRQYEEQRRRAELPTTYIAFEALGALLEGRKQYTDEQLRRAWPAEWGEQTIEVPAALVGALAECWRAYREAPSGKTLGMIFGLEGGGRGKHRTLSMQATRDRKREIAQAVVMEYLGQALRGTPVSVDQARKTVADALMDEGASYEGENDKLSTVEKAHKKFGPELNAKLRQAGVLR